MSERWVVNNVKGFLERISGCSLKVGANGKPLGFIVFFYDLHCPGCALLDIDLMDYFINLNRRGYIDLYFADYPVHRVELLHAKARVLFKRSIDEYFKALSTIYEGLVKGSLAKDIPGVADSEAEGEVEKVRKCKELARSINVVGTPTILLGRYDREVGVAVFGYDSPDNVMKLIEEVIFEVS